MINNYSTKALIARLEDGIDDAFLYVEVMDTLRARSKKGDLTAFQYLLQCTLDKTDESEESYG
jgi:hypothetical protein